MTEAEVALALQARDELRAAGHGAKSEIKSRWATHLGISVRQLERYLNRCGRSTNRKRRSDAGNTSVDRDAALNVTALTMASTRANGKQTLSIRRGAEIVRANDIELPVGGAHVARMLWKLGLHPTQLAAPDPAANMRSEHALHVMQIDASIPTLYYLDNGLHSMSPVEFNKNKPQHLERVARLRLLRYAMSDHYSGYGEPYYYTGGESILNLLDFTVRCFCRHGVPRILVLDPGAASLSDEMALLCDRLNVLLIVNRRGNARAKGCVEGLHNRIECEFESRLRFVDVASLDDINALAQQWASVYNETVPLVRRDGVERNRMDLFTSARPGQILVPTSADALRLLVESAPEHRMLKDDLSFSFAARGRRSRIYSARGVPHVYVGGKVEVITNPFDTETIRVRALLRPEGDDTWTTIAPRQFDDAGFALDGAVWGQEWDRKPHSSIDEHRREVLMASYGVDTVEAAEAAQRKRALPLQHIDAFADVKRAELPTRLPRATTPLQVEPDVAPLMLSTTDALFRVRELVGRHEYESIAATVRGWIESRYPDGVPSTAIASIAEQCTRRVEPPTGGAALRLAAAGAAA